MRPELWKLVGDGEGTVGTLAAFAVEYLIRGIRQ